MMQLWLISRPLMQATVEFMWLLITFSWRQLLVTVIPLLIATKSHWVSFRPAHTHVWSRACYLLLTGKKCELSSLS